MLRRVSLVVSVAALLLAPASALSQSAGEDFVPSGYRFCGWENLGQGTWTFGTPEPGAWLRVFARNLSCAAARRSYKRVHYTKTPPYRPVRSGYRCASVEERHEYSDVRCTKRGRRSVAFRWQTGS